jgi:aryl-alcohol dehydrogenase-like predicted oxidoreductase
MLPANAYLQIAPDLTMCRILNGMWQVSGAHGNINPRDALAAMSRYLDAGFTTFDLADHYGPAEDFIGAFRQKLRAERGENADANFQAFTKWVPRPGKMTRQIVEDAVNVSLRRMQTARLDLLQFHWWDYADERYFDALGHLADLQAAGKIRYLSLTNFDTERLQKIVARGIQITSNQVQYSLVDGRPAQKMADFCRQHNIHLLTYGTVGGGLLSEKYLGKPEPRGGELNTVSLRKYKQMVDAWGGWALFQDLLRTLKTLADKHGVSISNLAVAAILERPAVGGVIVGARLGLSEHLAETARVFDLTLDDSDRTAIANVTSRGRDLMRAIGDCGDEYR